MTYRPKKNSRKASGLALAAAIVSVLCFCFSPYLPAPVLQIFSENLELIT